MQMDYASYIPLFKALCDETRLQIVDMLSCGPLCACNLLESFSITQPTLSYHMQILTSCQLVRSERKGTWMNYSLNSEMFRSLEAFLKLISQEKEHCICNVPGPDNANACKHPCSKG